MNRYKRNMNTLTEEENKKLKDFKVCVIGCGGLGGYVIEMLGRLGIGHITCVDGDVFDESNLNRQILSDEISLGMSKAEKAAQRMKIVNSIIEVTSIDEMFTEINAVETLEGNHVVVDALDCIESRLLLQNVCEELKIPLIHGAIAGWYGQVSTILPGDRTLDFIYSRKKSSRGVEQELGNPSFTPAHIASLQVSEVVKLLLGRGEVLTKKIMFIDMLNNDYDIIEL
ncbi:HesA/MoeB/ThiF family protein [Oceanirhabdus sp. W0125-5]|uniref:HesA/MoeB/ThiF family protein n=1 Tax=Oceanirhabdus sp. W0125-5 TaxID=2999116 RepID=UPI0022F34424|nr:HesA/MoeB/ThiF family protein [Oceanirhabdus sp. W0125-5]WBW99746.1 HesA/MoeB/ThiF family protein [Oceanirhabdus sp. W0125-5]